MVSSYVRRDMLKVVILNEETCQAEDFKYTEVIYVFETVFTVNTVGIVIALNHVFYST